MTEENRITGWGRRKEETSRKGPVRRWRKPIKGEGQSLGHWGQGKGAWEGRQTTERLRQGEGRQVVREGQRSKKGPDKSGLIGQGLANCGPEAKCGLPLVLYDP